MLFSLSLASVVLPQLALAFQGRGTWYIVETGNAVSCGGHRSNGEFIVALAEHVAQRIGQQCGSQVCVRANGREATATIADTCPLYNEACTPANGDALDLSPGLAAALDPNYANTGVWDINWDLGPCGGSSPPPAPAPSPPPPPPAPQPAPAPQIEHWQPEQQWNNQNNGNNNQQQQNQWQPPAPAPPTSSYTPEYTPSSTSSSSSTSSAAPSSSSSAAPQRFAISVTSSAPSLAPSTGRQNAVKQPTGPVEGNLAMAGQIVVQIGQLGYAGVMAAQD